MWKIGNNTLWLLFFALMGPQWAHAAYAKVLRYSCSLTEIKVTWNGEAHEDLARVAKLNLSALLAEDDINIIGEDGDEVSGRAQLVLRGTIALTTTAGRPAALTVADQADQKNLDSLTLNLYLVDNTVGVMCGTYSRVLNLPKHSGVIPSSVQSAVREAMFPVAAWFSTQLAEIPWRGHVVSLEGGRVIVDRGSRAGLQVGRSLRVVSSQTIRDQGSGRFLYETVHELAHIRVEEVFDTQCVCVLVAGEAALIRSGMEVRGQ